jgi:exopolysaccharide biosynthesis WecB/TagA/CpsF family protein
MNQKVNLLGLDFDDLDMDDVIRFLLSRHPDEVFSYVVTPNIDHFARLRNNAKLMKIYKAAFLCLLDSRLLWRFLGVLNVARPSVITGADLVMKLLNRLDGQRVAIIGLREPDFIILKLLYPNILFSHHLPPMDLLQNHNAFALAYNFGATQHARFTFIALGSPLQELLADAIARQPRSTGIALCIGAALEFCVGRTSRAPLWMQDMGLEWLHRLVHNPVRLGPRYLLKDPPVLLAFLAAALRRT